MIGHFEPYWPSQAWNSGKGSRLVCPDCKQDSLMVLFYGDSIVVDCSECGAVWDIVREGKVTVQGEKP